MIVRELLRSLVASVVTFVIVAIAYPAIAWGLAHVLFPWRASGSLVERRDRTVVGSELIAQPSSGDGYFHPRPSAAGANGYAADAASGSNLGTKNPALRTRIVADVARNLVAHGDHPSLKNLLDRLDAEQAELKARNESADEPDAEAIDDLAKRIEATQAELARAVAHAPWPPVPVDLVTASGAGLDPHISPEAAHYQAARVARARGVDESRIRALIDEHVDRSGAILGAPPRVNVLRLNMALEGESSDSDSGPIAASATPADSASPTDADPAAPAVERLSINDGLLPARIDTRVALLEERIEALSSGERELADALKVLDSHVVSSREVIGESVASIKALEVDVASLIVPASYPEDFVAKVEREMEALRRDLDVAGVAARPAPPAEVADSAPIPVNSPSPLYAARAIFQDGKFAEAFVAFRVLTQERPDDARVWYYAALARGLSTGQWRGDVETLVAKGQERERAGTPSRETIDDTFALLTRERGREWLAAYRRQILRP